MSEWKDISTAPKDGTLIDLWHGEFGRCTDCFWGLPDHFCGESGSYCDSDWHSLDDCWVDASFNINTFEDGFTHWMPLPSPPSQTTNNDNGEE